MASAFTGLTLTELTLTGLTLTGWATNYPSDQARKIKMWYFWP